MTYDQPRGNFDMGRVIQRTFDVMGRNLGAFAGMALLTTFLPQAALGAAGIFVLQSQGDNVLAAGAGLGVVSWVVTLVGAYVLEAAILYASVNDLNGRRVEFGKAISTGFSFVLPLFGLGILMGLALLLGFILLIVPGILMSIAWIVAAPAVVVEKVGVTASFGRSADLTRNHRWPILGLSVVYLIVYFALSWAATLMFGGLAAAAGGVTDFTSSGALLNILVSPLVSAVLSLIGTTGVASIYFELRSIKEGVGAKDLAAVFD